LKEIDKSRSLKLMLGLLATVMIFHILVIVQIIPYEIVWAGKLQSIDDMYAFESMSILVNSFLITVLLLKGNFFKHRIPGKYINGIIWFFICLFALNTIGNLFAKTIFEKVVFTPLTLISVFLLWDIVRVKSDKTTS